MKGFNAIISLSLLTALLLSAVLAQGASGAGKGQTIFECSASATTKTFSDAHCDKSGGTGFGHVEFPQAAASIALTSGGTAEETKKATTAVMKIAKLHGVTNVVIECTNVEGTGEALNSENGGIMKGAGSGTIKLNNGAGVNCSTNQAGCTVKVAALEFEFETDEGLEGEGHGVRFSPKGTAANLTTVTFEGTCGLKAFGAIPMRGSTVATANGEPKGGGATQWFIEGTMNSLSVGGEPMQLIGKITLKRVSTSNALVFTTS